MRNYDLHICKCGRIHMVSEEKINNALMVNKDLLVICAGCGKAIKIGADIEEDWFEPDKDCYMMYTKDVTDNEDISFTSKSFETTEEEKGISEIIYSQGYKVPMKTGQYATDYFGERFSDRWYPDFYKIMRADDTMDEVKQFIKDYNHDRTTVNMERFTRETPDEILEELSNYWIKAFNWKGTKYEKEWNK